MDQVTYIEQRSALLRRIGEHYVALMDTLEDQDAAGFAGSRERLWGDLVEFRALESAPK